MYRRRNRASGALRMVSRSIAAMTTYARPSWTESPGSSSSPHRAQRRPGRFATTTPGSPEYPEKSVCLSRSGRNEPPHSHFMSSSPRRKSLREDRDQQDAVSSLVEERLH